MSRLQDTISLLTPAPDAIEPTAVRKGTLGSSKYYYWIIAHFPIGNTITTSPAFIRDAPDSFGAGAYVIVSWDQIIGATSYDVIRTTSPLYPTAPGNYLITSGVTSGPVNDLGTPSFFDPSTISGLPYGGPAECRISLNNRDYDRPTVTLPCSIAVTRIVFSDGSIQTSAPGTGGAPVTSVFGRQGAVIAQAGDYTAAQVTNAVSVLGSYADPSWITSLSWSKIIGAPPILTNPTTTKGDIIVNNGTTIVRLGVGLNGQVLTADSAQPNGIAWENAPVTSFNGRTGAILPQAGDYNAAMVTNAVSTLGTYPDPPWITSLSWSKIIGAPTLVTSFNGRTGAVVPQAGDYTAAMVTNAVSTINFYSDPGWITSLSWSKISGAPNFLVDPLTTKGDLLVRSATGDTRLPVGTDGQILTADSTQALGVKWAAAPTAPVTSVFGRTGAIVPLTGDYTASQITNAVDQTQTYSNPTWLTTLAWSKITGAPSLTPAPPAKAVQWNNGATPAAFGGSADLIWDQSSDSLNIQNNTTTNQSPTLQLTGLQGTSIGPEILMYSQDTQGCTIASQVYGTGPSGPPNITWGLVIQSAASRGTYNVPAAVQAGDHLFQIWGLGNDGAGNENGAYITAVVESNWTTSNNPAALTFATCANPTDGWSNCERMRISSTGKVGIGTTSPSYQLQLSTDSAAKPTTNTWTIPSDIRTKRNVNRFEGDIEVIRKLDPIVAEYNGLANTPDGTRVVSLDPEKLLQIVPQAVSSVRGKLSETDTEETDILGVNTHEIFYHILRAVQQLDARLRRFEAL